MEFKGLFSENYKIFCSNINIFQKRSWNLQQKGLKLHPKTTLLAVAYLTNFGNTIRMPPTFEFSSKKFVYN
jgi:hypothetical protein